MVRVGLVRSATNCLLAALMRVLWTGFCLSTAANTTALAQQGGALTPGEVPPQVRAQGEASPPTVVLHPAKTAVVRLTVLLPLQSDSLGRAAAAVRAGILAAHEAERSEVAVTIIETGDTPEEVLAVYTKALATTDIMLGPLSRSVVAALAQSDAVHVPTIALAQPEFGQTLARSPLLLTMGLAVEEEARQAADWMAADKTGGKLLAVATSIHWQRRAAQAFSAEAQRLGRDTEVIELGSAGGYLEAAALMQFRKQLQEMKPAALFVSLDAVQTRQLRAVIGEDLPIYGTSQLNPQALAEHNNARAEAMPELNGVRLLDLPWQLSPDHPAVMAYPQMAAAAKQTRNADLERLYALGIDAFRVARLVAAQRKQFELDGVTGKLVIGFNPAGTHFERMETRAIYRDGKAVPLDASGK
ncbi:MAG: penicillin-binding protein activator [Burkholderiaceae bacterium]|nr:penicillin-binding protein activator [Burkholderiaceae bacterium]